MARRARWAVGGLAHHVMLLTHNGAPMLADPGDCDLVRQCLRGAAEATGVAVHALAVRPNELHLLARPRDAADLGTLMQAFGRRFVAAYNARHGRSGTPWSGRFRAAPLEPGHCTLLALRCIDAWGLEAPGASEQRRWTGSGSTWLVDPPELWALGNTPFERERAYAQLLAELPAEGQRLELLAAVRRGLPLGSPAFLASLEQSSGRAARAGTPGRPRLDVRQRSK